MEGYTQEEIFQRQNYVSSGSGCKKTILPILISGPTRARSPSSRCFRASRQLPHHRRHWLSPYRRASDYLHRFWAERRWRLPAPTPSPVTCRSSSIPPMSLASSPLLHTCHLLHPRLGRRRLQTPAPPPRPPPGTGPAQNQAPTRATRSCAAPAHHRHFVSVLQPMLHHPLLRGGVRHALMLSPMVASSSIAPPSLASPPSTRFGPPTLPWPSRWHSQPPFRHPQTPPGTALVQVADPRWDLGLLRAHIGSGNKTRWSMDRGDVMGSCARSFLYFANIFF
jgi:hypothetical protein